MGVLREQRAERATVGFVLIASAFCLYAFVYLARMSFVVNGVRYFTLADDQMISMRYAENLASGHGLVWNAGGERVEGYTNFLWVVYMALFHWMRVPRPIVSLCVQASGALFLLANLAVVRTLALRISGSAGAALMAVGLVAFYVPLDNWAFQGVEVSVLTLLVTCSAAWAIEAFNSDTVPWRLFVLLGVATTIRPDMVVLAVVVLTAVARARPDSFARRLLIGAAIVTGFVAAQTAFRLWYFGDPLPNTYYLKVTGSPLLPKITHGLMVSGLFVAQILPLAIPMCVKAHRLRVGAEVRLLLAIFVAQMLYSISVGGDSWEWWGGSNRFVAIAMPLFFICAAPALVHVWDRLAPAVTLAPALAAALVILLVNYVALSVAEDRLTPLKRIFLVVKPYESSSDERAVRAGLALREFTSDNAVVGVVWAGAIPYFSERSAVDLLGKMDRRIAREPVHLPETPHTWMAFYPGHMKWDYEYSINQLKPDVVEAPLWHLRGVPEEPMPYLDREYRRCTTPDGWYLRKSSLHLRWAALEGGCPTL